MLALRRVGIVLFTVGWIAPLTCSFAMIYDFIRIVWRRANFGTRYDFPWHGFEIADDLFYLSMVWLALVMIGWALHFTRNQT